MTLQVVHHSKFRDRHPNGFEKRVFDAYFSGSMTIGGICELLSTDH
jgi:hypothetical protein